MRNDDQHEQPQDAMSVERFCRQHGLSVSFYYKLRGLGQTPREMHLGRRVLISQESAAAWRREREGGASSINKNRKSGTPSSKSRIFP